MTCLPSASLKNSEIQVQQETLSQEKRMEINRDTRRPPLASVCTPAHVSTQLHTTHAVIERAVV